MLCSFGARDEEKKKFVVVVVKISGGPGGRVVNGHAQYEHEQHRGVAPVSGVRLPYSLLIDSGSQLGVDTPPPSTVPFSPPDSLDRRTSSVAPNTGGPLPDPCPGTCTFTL